MKIAVWKTGHEIADTVAEAVYEGLRSNRKDIYSLHSCASIHWRDQIPRYDIHIAYGILRGASEVFREANKAKKPWFNIDKGYWKSGHYDGYYRVSVGGTQQTTGLDKIKPDYDRWDNIGIEIRNRSDSNYGPILCCGPTEYTSNFFLEKKAEYWYEANTYPLIYGGYKTLIRNKGCEDPLQNNLNDCSKVLTFNSSIGWEALRQGIPVTSDPTHSIIGAYVKQNVDKGDISFASRIHKDVNMRRELFALMAGLQLTLAEMRAGQLWPLMSKLLEVHSIPVI